MGILEDIISAFNPIISPLPYDKRVIFATPTPRTINNTVPIVNKPAINNIQDNTQQVFNNNRQGFANQLLAEGKKAGLKNPNLMIGISTNENSMNPTPNPNINPREQSYGLAQINLLAHPDVTQQQAEDINFAIPWMANRLKSAQALFPESVERQILYYNVPQNAFNDPNQLSYQAAWYLQNALKTMGLSPSQEYLPVLQQYGFYK